MSQGVLGFKYEEEKHDSGMTGLAGLPIYLDLLHAMGLPELIGRHLQVKQRGLPDAQMVLSLVITSDQFSVDVSTLLSALTGECCLFPVFFFFPLVQGLVLLRATGFLNRPDDVYRRHPALESKILFFLPSLRTSLFSV